MERVAQVRQLFAGLINAEPREIAFVTNTSEGLSIIAAGLNWKSGDEALVPTGDFPANIYPWMNPERHGVEVRFFPRDHGRCEVKAIEKALCPGARLLAVSSVDFKSGFRYDLEVLGDLCRRKSRWP